MKGVCRPCQTALRIHAWKLLGPLWEVALLDRRRVESVWALAEEPSGAFPTSVCSEGGGPCLLLVQIICLFIHVQNNDTITCVECTWNFNLDEIAF